MVQVVHYPLFAHVGETAWRSYHANHNVLITLIVLPAMVLEAGTAALFLLNRPGNVTFIEALIGLALVGIAWGTTFFLSVPYHNSLAGGFNQRAYDLLISTNWLRTLAWSARSGLVLWQVWKQI